MSLSNFFVPQRQNIEGITNANPGVVTTTEDHGYPTGLFVRLVFPENFGMQQVAGKMYEIEVLSDDTFAINADTTNFDVYSAVGREQVAQVIPIGYEVTSVLDPVRNNGTIIPEL
jgi:hypothetical protein